MKYCIPLLFFTIATSQAAVIYDGIRTGYSGIGDFYDTDDTFAIYLSLASTGYKIDSAEAMRVWNAAPFSTWPTGDPVIQIFGTNLGSNLGGGIESPNYGNLLGTLSFSTISEVRGTTAATQEIVNLITPAPISLPGNKNYWVVVTMASGGNGMSLTATPTANGTIGQNIIGSSTDAAQTITPASGNLSIRLNGTAIPEPGCFSLLLLASCGLLRRKRPVY